MQRSSLLGSFVHAFVGMIHVVRAQRNARIHVLAALAVVGAGIWLDVNAIDWALLSLAIGTVVAAECVNTSLEAAVDLISPEWNETARIAKDCAAGGVVCSALAAVVVGVAVLGQPLWARLALTESGQEQAQSVMIHGTTVP